MYCTPELLMLYFLYPFEPIGELGFLTVAGHYLLYAGSSPSFVCKLRLSSDIVNLAINNHHQNMSAKGTISFSEPDYAKSDKHKADYPWYLSSIDKYLIPEVENSISYPILRSRS